LAGLVGQRFGKIYGVGYLSGHIDIHLYVILIEVYLYVKRD
jgi:hypothetical protein